MQLPINIPELLKIATDLKEVSNTPLSVSVFIDDTAPNELISHVRAAFASAGAHTRVTISYLDDTDVTPHEKDDIAVIIAGVAPNIGSQAALLREQGIPTMVVTNAYEVVCETAEAGGHPIPQADIITPVKLSARNPITEIPFIRNYREKQIMERAADAADEGEVVYHSVATVERADADQATEAVTYELPADGPDPFDSAIELDPATLSILDNRMGEWILTACSEKKLAFALAFPFVRRPLAHDSVTSTSLQNGAIGLVPLIPGADLPIMTLNQAKMVLQIATAYGQPLDTARIKEIAAVVAGGFAFRNIARSLARVIPVAGLAISGAVGFVGTEAMGRAVIEYFEAGGDLVGVAKVVQKARDEAIDATKKAAATPAGQKVVDMAKRGIKSAVATLRS